MKLEHRIKSLEAQVRPVEDKVARFLEDPKFRENVKRALEDHKRLSDLEHKMLAQDYLDPVERLEQYKKIEDGERLFEQVSNLLKQYEHNQSKD